MLTHDLQCTYEQILRGRGKLTPEQRRDIAKAAIAFTVQLAIERMSFDVAAELRELETRLMEDAARLP